LTSKPQRKTRTDASGYQVLTQAPGAPAALAGYEPLGVLTSNDYALLGPPENMEYSTFGPLTSASET
jgi:hypothetical protein